MRRAIICAVVVGAAALVLANCSNGGSYLPPTEGRVVPLPATGVLDLASGSFVAGGTTAGSGQVLFRQLSATGTVTGGDALSAAGSTGASTTGAAAGPILLGVSELSRAQWQALAGSTPWTALPTDLRGTDAGTTAAAGLSWDAIAGALDAWNASHAPYRLRLPTPAEWEVACRAGSTTPYAWGSLGASTAAYANQVRARDTRAAADPDGPSAITASTANAYGYLNMHGNLWEWLQDRGDATGSTAHLRGGSWHDEVVRAQAGNRLAMPRGVAYGTAGVRLVLEIP
jgi:sulfatase modifying factor 1